MCFNLPSGRLVNIISKNDKRLFFHLHGQQRLGWMQLIILTEVLNFYHLGGEQQVADRRLVATH